MLCVRARGRSLSFVNLFALQKGFYFFVGGKNVFFFLSRRAIKRVTSVGLRRRRWNSSRSISNFVFIFYNQEGENLVYAIHHKLGTVRECCAKYIR